MTLGGLVHVAELQVPLVEDGMLVSTSPALHEDSIRGGRSVVRATEGPAGCRWAAGFRAARRNTVSFCGLFFVKIKVCNFSPSRFCYEVRGL